MDTGNDEPLNKIEDSIGRMDTIIEDVLTLVQGGQSIDKSKPTSLDAVAREAWEHVATETATLAIRTDEIVEADRSRLLQLFENLFRNAHEHGGDDVSVTVDVTEDRFYVQDDGPGIPADNRNKVLESGYTTNENAGFGLTIVSEIAQAYGWDVFVAEGPGGGTRFDIEVNDFPERA
jgi:signal transduction histidine kinase